MDPSAEHLKLKEQIRRLDNAVLAILVIAAYAFILFQVLDYRMNWQSWDYPEGYYPRIIQNGPRILLEDITRIFNAGKVGFLQNPGRVRYFQDLVLFLDAKTRIWLFNYLPPHPSVSITWITTLFVAPYFFYKFLRLWSKDRNTAKIAVIVFMFSTGYLSHINLLCNPGKPLATAIVATALYFAAKTYVLLSGSGRITTKVFVNYLLLLSVLFIGFFTDETAWILFVAVPLMVPGLFKIKGTRILSSAIYLSVFAILMISVIHIAPELISRFTPGNPRINIVSLNLAPSEDSAPMSRVWEWFNLRYFIRSTRNLLSSQLVVIGHPWTIFAYMFIVPYLLYIYKKMNPDRKDLVLRGVAAVFVYIAHQSFGFTSVYYEDGFAILYPYYYGALLSIFLAIPIAVLLSSGASRYTWWINRAILLFVVFVMTHNYYLINKDVRNIAGEFMDYGHLKKNIALKAWNYRDNPAAIKELKSRYPRRSPWNYIQEMEIVAEEYERKILRQ